MGGRASLDGHRLGLHPEILALRRQGRHGGEAGLDEHRPSLIPKSLLYGAKDVMEARQAWMLERIRLNCVSECEHHQRRRPHYRRNLKSLLSFAEMSMSWKLSSAGSKTPTLSSKSEVAAQLRGNVDELETLIGRVEDAHIIGEV